ncbi:unnamed protein product [Arctogadus glacialis]
MCSAIIPVLNFSPKRSGCSQQQQPAHGLKHEGWDCHIDRVGEPFSEGRVSWIGVGGCPGWTRRVLRE